MKQTSPLIFAVFLVFLIIIPFSPGLQISSFIALALVSYCKQGGKGLLFTLTATLFLVAISYTSYQVLYHPQITGSTNSSTLTLLISLEKPVMLLIFSSILYFYYPQKISSLAGILCLTVVFLFLEKILITQLLKAFPPFPGTLTPADNPYIDFSPGREEFEIVMSEVSNRAKEVLDEKSIPAFKTAMNQIARFQGTLNTIMSSLYVLLFIRFFTKSFISTSFRFTTFRLPTVFTYFFLAFWAILLGSISFFAIDLTANTLFLNLIYSALVLMTFLFFLQGLAIVFYKILRWNSLLKRNTKDSSKAVGGNLMFRPRWTRTSFFALLFLIPLLFFGNPIGIIALLLSIILLGILDIWFDYRKMNL